MAEDRKKMLEALVAKRKAEAEGGVRSAPKPKPKSSSLLSKPSPVKKSSPLLHTSKPSPLLKQQKPQHVHKKDSPPKKKKRVEKYESEDGDESDEDSDSDSEDEPVKKKVPSSKGDSAVKGSSLKPTPVKSKQDVKGRPFGKEKDSLKGKKKSEDSSDDDVEDGASDEEDAEPDSGDEGLDKSNILSGRTRRGRGSQPVHYDFTNMSDDDDESD